MATIEPTFSWTADRIVRDRYQGLSDKVFYKENQELLPFDNGEGFWTAGENRDVEMGEFVAYGRKALQKQGVKQVDETLAFEKASVDLLAILLKKGAPFARYTMANVLDRKVAARFLEQGGRQFYLTALPRSVAKHFSERGSKKDPCLKHNQLAVDPEGNIKLTEGKWEVDTFGSGMGGQERATFCSVKAVSFDPKGAVFNGQVTTVRDDYSSFPNQTVKPLGKWEMVRGLSELGWNLKKIALENDWQVYPTKSPEENDFAWRLSVLSEYLYIQGGASL